jgi:glutamate--cysteine ligase
MGDQVATVLRDRATAEKHVAGICFKHGPPRRYGVELEWIVHHADDPRRPLHTSSLAHALGPYAPPTVSPSAVSPARPARLCHGSSVTVEPGGQVELSSAPHGSFDALLTATSAEIEQLSTLLGAAGLVRADHALDCHRPPTRLLDTPRYASMHRAFDEVGPFGLRMMCSTAALQVCLDVGPAERLPARWAAVHGLGPVFVALFANSAAVTEDGQAWECARMRSVFATDPCRTLPTPPTDDPAGDWARRVLDTPLLCLRRADDCWDAPPDTTFGDWVDGALATRPTTDDLAYHLTTLFTPVRPRGYLEVRYIDAQADGGWVLPVALLTALMADEDMVDAVREVTAPVVSSWLEAAQQGLAYAPVALAAARVLDLGVEAVERLRLPEASTDAVLTALRHRRAALVPTKGMTS